MAPLATPLRQVIDAYSKETIWSKVGKRVCGGTVLGLSHARFLTSDWGETLRAWVDELVDVEKNYRPIQILEPYGESSHEFLARLACTLCFASHVSSQEKGSLLDTLRGSSAVFKPENQYAQALFVKALLEMSRARPLTPRSLAALPLWSDLRTIDELISYPLRIPLPACPEDYDRYWDAPIPKEWHTDAAVVEDLLRARLKWLQPDVVEFHLSMSHYRADWPYKSAIREVSLQYASLASAYETIRNESALGSHETIFIEKYRFYRDLIKDDLPREVYDPASHGFVRAPWLQ